MNVPQMKRYLVLLLALLCVGSTGCSIQQTDQSKNKASLSDSSKKDVDSSQSDDNGQNNEPNATPLAIRVFDSGKTIAVTEQKLTDITLSEEEGFVQANNNIINGNFIHPYQGGYFYGAQKGGDGPNDALVYDNGQGQITGRSDLPDYLLHISKDSFYYWDGNSVKCQTGGETQNIITSRYSYTMVCLAEDGIYYAQVDDEKKTTYLGLVDYEGKMDQQLYALDMEVSQIYFYQDELWFVFQEFEDENDVVRLGKINLADQDISIYHLNGNLNGNSSAEISIQNGYVYFNASGLKRLNIQDNTVEQVYSKNVDCINFAEDSILFARGRTLYRMNQDGTTKIQELRKDYDGIAGIHVEDQKVYLMSYAGALYDCINQIDLSGKILQKIYQGQQYDELVG